MYVLMWTNCVRDLNSGDSVNLKSIFLSLIHNESVISDKFYLQEADNDASNESASVEYKCLYLIFRQI